MNHNGIDISKSPDYVKLVRKMNKALDFLSSHPACGAGAIFNLHDHLWYSAQEVCKRGYSEFVKRDLDLRYTPENYKRYKELFDKEFKEEPEVKELVRITVPYEEHFGEPWKFDHVEYWGEMSFVMFLGNDFDKYHDPKYWERCSGVDTGGRSFEEMIINVAKEFKKIFGDFTDEDFLTKEEKENHKKENPFFFVPCKDNPKHSLMKHNGKYQRVDDAEINRRWVKWFITTPYAKKNWKETCEEILAGKINRNYNLEDARDVKKKLTKIVREWDRENCSMASLDNFIRIFNKVRKLAED